MGSRTTSAVGWALWGGIVLCAAAGAARTPEGLRLVVPGVALAAAIAAIAVVAAWRRPHWGATLLGLAVVPAVWLLAPGSLVAGALSGAPVLAFALAALVLASGAQAPPRRLFVPVVFALYLAAAAQVQRQVGPQGDEPHYLMVADSLLRDGDLSLEQDYKERRYEAFFDGGTLDPHFRQRGKNGEVFSLHAVGLSLLVLPFYAAGGYPLVSLFMACLGALTAVAVRSLCRTAAGEEAGDAAGWIVAVSPPLLHYAGLVFTEVPAALIAAWALREGCRAADARVGRAAVVGLALGFLPWLNVRYAIVAGLIGLFWMAARPGWRVLAALVAPGVASAAALALYHHALYGFFDPRRVYGKQREFAFDTLKEGLPGILLDQEFGLLVYAPVFVLAVPGLWRLCRERPRLGAAAGALVAAVLLTAASWHMWRGGFNPPARFLVPIVPALALGIAVWMRGRVWVGLACLVGWSAFVGSAGALDPRLVHRDRDVTAPLFRAHAGATEWTRLLPSYVLEESERHRLAAVWGALLIAASVRARAGGARSIAAALGAIALSAGVAGRLTDARAGGREATRGLGGIALDWPRPRLVRVSDARWTPREWTWGPLYEPHRHSRRVAIADRLELPPGRHRIEISAERLAGDGGPGLALVIVGPYGRVIGRSACTVALACEVDVPEGVPEITLRLEGGTPLLIKEIRLLQPFPGAGV